MSFNISEKHKQSPHHPHLTKVVLRTAGVSGVGKFHLLLENFNTNSYGACRNCTDNYRELLTVMIM
jgi:hypothetical protein